LVNTKTPSPSSLQGCPGFGVVAVTIEITEKMKIAAAEALAGMIIPTEERILPSALDKEVPTKIAEAVKKSWEEGQK